MAFAHAPLGLASAILLATSILFLFFVILSGVSHHTPLNRTYFLQADTHGITGAHDTTQWTYFYACGEGNTDCGSAHPAMPFGKAWAADPTGAPDALTGKYGGHTTSFYYYYMWRFGWVFYLLALLFEVLAFFSSFCACFGRLGSGISGLVTLLAFVFLSIGVSLMTATFVRARNVFHAAGRSAKLGKYAFGFSWGAYAALIIALVLLCTGTARKGSGGRRRSSAAAVHANGNDGLGPDGLPVNGATNGGGAAAAKPARSGWRRNRNRHRAGSFSKVNYEDGRLDNVSV